MRKLIYILSLAGLIACKKQHISTDEVLHTLQLSPNPVDADGSSPINVSIRVNSSADVARRKVILETSAGTFSSTSTKTTTVEALYENGELIARATIKAPISPGFVVVTAKPELRNPYNDFLVKDSVQAIISTPSSISLTPSAFGVQTAYVNEVLITGTLKNLKNRNVSSNTKVIFTDVYANGTPVGGRFRQVQNSSDENSKVSAYYSPGLVTPGTSFYIRATVLDAAGNPTSITDAVLLTVIP